MEKAKQLEAAHVALAEEASLYIEGGLTAENMEKQHIPKPRPPVIIYATRTHSQITQVVSEFQRTAYASSLSMCVLGSRSQMCIHPTVSLTRGGAGVMNRACSTAVQRSSCVFHSNVELYKQNLPRTRDIEDLVIWGRRHSACPYFIAKDQQAVADIVFIPYNYIIDPLIRRSMNIDLKGSIVILDEAHNLEQVASDSASFDLSSSDLKLCLTQIQQCLDAFGGSLPELPTEQGNGTSGRNNPSASEGDAEPPLADPSRTRLMETHDDTTTTSTAHAILLKEAITALLNEFTTATFAGGTNVKVSDGKWIFELFERIGITADSAPAYLRTVDQVAMLMQEGSALQLQMAQMAPSSQNAWAAANALSSFSESLRKMFMTGVPISEASGHLKAVLQRDTNSRSNMFQSKSKPVVGAEPNTGASNPEKRSGPFDRQWTYKLSLWCFYPGLAMQSLMGTGIRSLIVTSGTLSPLDSFAYELSIPFQIRLENPHVIPTSQIWVGVLPTAVNGETLNSAFTNRSELYTQSLGHTLTNISRISPGGLLVFFPSYRMMEDCIEMWKSGEIDSNIWSQICRYKRPVMEPRESSKLKATMKEFYEKVDQKAEGDITGAVFFAVCRGKVSEGLDFSNNYGRTVVVTGLPFAQNMDQKVKLKREYLDQQAAHKLLNPPASSPVVQPSAPVNTHKPLTGNEWYAQSAWRAVNQAIGRVIRHRNDYGAILFLDERFVGSASTHLSKWLRPHVHTMRTPGPMFQAVAKFFQANASQAAAATAATASAAASSAPATLNRPFDPPTPSRGALLSQVAVANSKRRSVFEVRNDIVAAPSTPNISSATAQEPTKVHKVEQAQDNPSKAAHLLSMARTQLTSEAFQAFQTATKKFKNRQLKRSELLASLSTLLQGYPAFLAALDDYLSQSKSATSAAKLEALPSSPHSGPSPNLPSPRTVATVTSPSHRPISSHLFPPERLSTPTGSPQRGVPPSSPHSTPTGNTIPSASSTSHSTAPSVRSPSKRPISSHSLPPELLPTSTREEGHKQFPTPAAPAIPIELDPPSLEIITPTSFKKRERMEGESDESTPSAKRSLVPTKEVAVKGSNVAQRPIMQRHSIFGVTATPKAVPDDSILDLSTHSPQASQSWESPSNAPQKPIIVHSIPSQSLEVLSQPFRESETVIELSMEVDDHGISSSGVTVSSEIPVPLPRKASSDLEPILLGATKGSSWLQGLTRGNSAGVALPQADRHAPSPTTASIASYGTPKKGMVDLLTGQIVPRGMPKRSSPPKPPNEPVLIPDSAPPLDIKVDPATAGPAAELVSAIECPICAKSTTNFQSAPCGHRCCADCWQAWLKNKMECPFCRGRVRAKKLKDDQ
jgi:regulator of telomere elongation helicase 1